MCLALHPDEQSYALYDAETKRCVLFKMFQLINGRLEGFLRRYEYKLVYQKHKHWFYVPPDIQEQPVEVGFFAVGLGKGVGKYCITTKELKLGYHASLFRKDPTAVPIPGNCVVFPILITKKDIMMVSHGTVVVKSFWIPDPQHHQRLYEKFLRQFAVTEVGAQQMMATIEASFGVLKVMQTRRSK